jgi:chemotaxis protein methyltransferase CheR
MAAAHKATVNDEQSTDSGQAPWNPGVVDKPVFDEFRRIVYDRCGISLGDKKEALVAARVGKRMRVLDIDSHEKYLHFLKEDETGEEIVHLIDAISTNVTSFFREGAHFEMVSKIFAGWRRAGQNKFRFWSAACSTGEEPYTLAMTLLDAAGGDVGDTKILATDISTKVLDKCKEATYTPQKCETVPPTMLDRYFDRQDNSAHQVYSIKPNVKKMIVFTRINLSKPPFPMAGPMDAIFCRNVMIYFDNTVRKNLLAEMYRLLKPGGYLFVGHAESLTGMLSGFKIVQPSVYMKGETSSPHPLLPQEKGRNTSPRGRGRETMSG